MAAVGRADTPAGGGQLGHGGISEVSRACGLSRKAIAKGMQEIEAGTAPPPGRVRRPGAGRKKITAHDPGLMPALERLIKPGTRGDPESPLRWTCKSTRTLAGQLTRHKHPISHMKVAQLLHEQGYSLQGNRKTEEGGDHPDRDGQFRHINTEVKRALAKGTPVISVDTKKKELVGNYENKGQQRFAVAAVEAGIAETGGRQGPCHFRLPLPAGHQQMEQDRTPVVLLHFLELARPAATGLQDDREADLSNHHGQRSYCDLSLGPAQIPDRTQGDG